MTEHQRRAVLGRLARFEAERNAAKSETAVQEKTNRPEDTPKTKAELLFQGQLNPTRKRKIVRLEQWVEVTIQNGVTVTKQVPSNAHMIRKGQNHVAAAEVRVSPS